MKLRSIVKSGTIITKDPDIDKVFEVSTTHLHNGGYYVYATTRYRVAGLAAAGILYEKLIADERVVEPEDDPEVGHLVIKGNTYDRAVTFHRKDLGIRGYIDTRRWTYNNPTISRCVGLWYRDTPETINSDMSFAEGATIISASSIDGMIPQLYHRDTEQFISYHPEVFTQTPTVKYMLYLVKKAGEFKLVLVAENNESHVIAESAWVPGFPKEMLDTLGFPRYIHPIG